MTNRCFSSDFRAHEVYKIVLCQRKRQFASIHKIKSEHSLMLLLIFLSVH